MPLEIPLNFCKKWRKSGAFCGRYFRFFAATAACCLIDSFALTIHLSLIWDSPADYIFKRSVAQLSDSRRCISKHHFTEKFCFYL
jgi:hypothetical protein